MITYGKRMELGGAVITTSGYESPGAAEEAVYASALRAGWRPPPLRRFWWQFWRPSRYDPPLALALKYADD